MYDILNLLTPWITLVIILGLLLWVQRWIHRHLFGVSYLASKQQGLAALLYLIILLPGVLVREVSRYLVAGMFRIRPAFVTPVPQAGEDGIVDIRFIHFAILNPFYAAIIGATPFLAGMSVTVAISYILGIPEIIRLIGANDSLAVREALLNTLSRPELIIWLYILFTVANTMMPTPGEMRASWIFWVIIGLVFLVLAIVGLYNTIVLLLGGPVAQIIYAMCAVFAIVLVLDLIAMVVISIMEAIVSRLTNQRIEYRPPQPQQRQPARLSGPRTVFDLPLPIPGPPGKALPAGVTPKKLGPGQGAPQPGEQPAIPARTPGTGLPAANRPLPPAPQPLPGPPPAPAKPLPGAPPAKLGPAAALADQPDEPAIREKPAAAAGPAAPRPAPLASPSAMPRPAGGADAPRPAPGVPVTPAAKLGESGAPKSEPKPGSAPFPKLGDKPGDRPATAAGPATPSPALGRPATGPLPKLTTGTAPTVGAPTDTTEESPAKPPAPPPLKPAVSGVPALARPSDPVRKPTLPSISDRPAKPAPKPVDPARRAETRAPGSFSAEDYIDADVIEDDEGAGDLNYSPIDET